MCFDCPRCLTGVVLMRMICTCVYIPDVCPRIGQCMILLNEADIISEPAKSCMWFQKYVHLVSTAQESHSWEKQNHWYDSSPCRLTFLHYGIPSMANTSGCEKKSAAFHRLFTPFSPYSRQSFADLYRAFQDRAQEIISRSLGHCSTLRLSNSKSVTVSPDGIIFFQAWNYESRKS